MSNSLESRRKLFNLFSSQLHLLKENGIIDIELKYEKTYICPICVRQFEENDIISNPNKNFLTEEDAPPAKLGGRRIALTCKECNSGAGHEVDVHLINRIKLIDAQQFYKGSMQYGYIEHEGENFLAEITSEGNGTLKVFHRTKNNNPTLLDKFMYAIKNKTAGPFLNIKPREQKNDDTRVNLAMLKTNYIITFSKFGYIFLLDEYYDNIRQEIRDMDKGYSGQIFINNQFQRNQTGTYYVMNPNAKSIFNIFSLNTEYSETVIGAILPFPRRTPEEIHRNLVNGGYEIGQEGSVGVNLDTTNYDPNANFFNDLKEIRKIVNWKNAP